MTDLDVVKYLCEILYFHDGDHVLWDVTPLQKTVAWMKGLLK
jgi:hypothetical protein